MLHSFEHSRDTWQLDTLWWRTSPKLTSLGTNLDAILLAQIKLPHQRFGAFDSSPIIAETHRWLPVSAVLMHLSSVFTELLTGKPLRLPCLSTRFTSMDTPFQVTPHYYLLSPMHPIYFWCFKTFSWHDFVSNHLPIIATHGRPKHLTRGSRGLPETARIVGWGVMGPYCCNGDAFFRSSS